LPFKNKNSPGETYQIQLEKALAVALVLVILLMLLFPRIKIGSPIQPPGMGTMLTVEDIPITRQGKPVPPPPRPTVPIPSEDDIIPDNVTIEDTELDFDSFSSSATPGRGLPMAPAEIIQPRPIFEVIPEYSENLQKRGIEGVVKLHLHIDRSGNVTHVIILENTTGSRECANAAKKAALRGRYIPAQKNGKPTDIWLVRTYTFGLQK